MLESLTQLTPKTLTDDCYHALKQAILNLELAPGTPLMEAQLAERFHTSKTPVRQAMTRLAGEGLVQTTTTGRSAVTGLSVQQIRHLYNLRSLLEPAAVERIAGSLNDGQLAHLADLITSAEQHLHHDELPQFNRTSEAFHTSLLELHENPLLMAMARNLFDQTARVRAALFRLDGVRERRHELLAVGIANHREILAALAVHDAGRAAICMRGDLDSFLRLIDDPATEQSLAQLTTSTSTRRT